MRNYQPGDLVRYVRTKPGTIEMPSLLGRVFTVTMTQGVEVHVEEAAIIFYNEEVEPAETISRQLPLP